MMLKIERISSKSRMLSWLKQMNSGMQIPEFLFEDEAFQGVVIGLKTEAVPAGIAYGVMKKGVTLFFIHGFYLSKEYRNKGNILLLLDSLFTAAKENTDIRGASWSYFIEDGIKDAHAALISKISYCWIQKKSALRLFRGQIADTLYWKKLRWCSEESIIEKGFYTVSWESLPNCFKEELEAKELRGELAEDYLSPFLEDEKLLDQQTSFALMEKATGALKGWFICEKASEQEAMIRRFFVYSDTRTRGLGPALLVHIMERIGQHYEGFQFEVYKENRQMVKATRTFGKPEWEAKGMKYSLLINFIDRADGSKCENAFRTF